MSKHIIFGAPGTGKTTKLLAIIEEHMNKGMNPSKICFCSYSRASAHEAIERATSKFGIEKTDMPFFGTIHSICFKRFCFDKKVINNTHRKKFFEEVKVDFHDIQTDEDLLTSEEVYDEVGNIILNFYDKLRLFFCKKIDSFNKREIAELFFKLPMNEEDYSDLFGGTADTYNILTKYEEFKKKEGIIDFIDMLFIAKENKWVVPTEILIIDEFQDLSPLQYEIYQLWSDNKKEVYLAGDDDQTIYKFICANPHFLLNEKKNLGNNDEEIILKKTYRLPKNIHEYCLDYIRMNIRGERIDKDVLSLKEGGEIIEEDIDCDLERVLEFLREDKFTFILFRTNYYKKVFVQEVLIPKGLVYNEIRGQGLWNNKTINLFNACINLVEKKNLTYTQIKYLIESIPFKHGLLKKGLKSKFKEMPKETEYNLSSMLQLGFNLKLFDFLDYEKLFSIINLKENVKLCFMNTPKKGIEYPVKLRIGTIHSSKGKEADDVILFKDIPKRIANELSKGNNEWDSEIRVFHVGQTRAKERLIILRGGFEYAESDVIP